MSERNIKLTIDEVDSFKCRHTFTITLGDNGAEIRVSGSPVLTRDSSIVTFIGIEPNVVDVTITVEEMP